MENSDKDVQVESKSKATCEKKPQPRLINDQDEEGNNESSSETMTKKTINATRSEADAALEKQSDVKESEDKNITSNVVKENINKSNKKVEKMYSVLVDNYTMSDVSETIHYANAAVLDGNENIKCATLSPVCVLPITEDNAYYEPVISKSDDCKSSDKNNNIEVSCNLTNFTNISSLQEDEPEICEELGHIYDSRNEYSNSTIHGISGSDKLLGLGLASKSVESGQKDHRNNTAIRLESVHTPKGDGISSPEVFRLTHLSPTLYGYETSLMMTKPNQTSFSRAGSTLNTPELQCVEDLDHRDIFTSHSASSTLSCDQKKRKLSSYDYFQEENENPLHFETSDLQPNFVSDQKYPKSTYIDSTNYINNAYTQHTFSQSLDLKANQSYQSISRPSCKYPGWNANQTMDATNSRLKSHTACRLDFESPVYLSCLSDIESSVDFKHCKNWSQNYGVNNFSAPPFISNKVCLSDNLTRPQPIIPTVSSYQHYPGMNTSYDLDTSSQALLYPSIPIVAMQNACLKTSSSGVSTSETHTSPLQPTYQYRQDVDHSASHISSLYTAVSPVATSFTSTSITNSTYNCDQNENDIHRPRGNIRSSATFSRQNISMSYQNESPAVIATPLDRINNNTDTEKVLANVNFADVDVARIQVNNSINCHLIPETGKTLMGLTNSCDKMGIVNVPDIPQDIASHTNTSGNIMDSSDLDNYKPTDDMVLPIKVKNKNVSITVSELRSKTVRQLYEKAKVNESDEDNYNIEVSRRKKVQCNRAFIARYEKEKRTRSPISAFCAALNVKEPPKTKPILPAIAEPRIPIETLLSQNEVPMVHDGSMLVPYFNPSMQHTLHYTAHASSVVQSRLKLQHPRYKNISNVKMTQTQCPNQLPLTMAVPLYANPVPENNILQAVPAQQPLTNIPRVSQAESMTRSQTATCLLYPPCTNHIVQIPQPCSASKTSSNKKFKAKHYSFSVLTIGKYKYKCDLQTSDRVARIKFLFSKRQLIYEYQVDLCSSLFTKKQMLEVVIPFHTICQIALENNEMKLELTHAPAMYKGIRGPLKTSTHNIINQTAQYNRRKLVDETNGQLSKCPFHCFKVACDSKIRSDLMAFHHSFKQMLQQQFVQDPTKTFRGMEVSICSNLLHPDIHLPTEQSNSRSFTEFTSRLAHNLDLPTTMCSCKEDCSHNKGCNCCLMGVKCTSGWCNCSKCQNPLNILQNMGCNKDKVTTDQCLMDNVYQICNRCYFAGESGVFKCSACVTSTVTKDEDGDTADEDLTADLTADDELSTDSTTE